jgi:ribosomal protein L14
MLILGSKVNVADNSGAITVGVIKILGSHNYGIIGDFIIVSIKK